MANPFDSQRAAGIRMAAKGPAGENVWDFRHARNIRAIVDETTSGGFESEPGRTSIGRSFDVTTAEFTDYRPGDAFKVQGLRVIIIGTPEVRDGYTTVSVAATQ